MRNVRRQRFSYERVAEAYAELLLDPPLTVPKAIADETEPRPNGPTPLSRRV